jgi:hypothetical protein
MMMFVQWLMKCLNMEVCMLSHEVLKYHWKFQVAIVLFFVSSFAQCDIWLYVFAVSC